MNLYSGNKTFTTLLSLLSLIILRIPYVDVFTEVSQMTTSLLFLSITLAWAITADVEFGTVKGYLGIVSLTSWCISPTLNLLPLNYTWFPSVELLWCHPDCSKQCCTTQKLHYFITCTFSKLFMYTQLVCYIVIPTSSQFCNLLLRSLFKSVSYLPSSSPLAPMSN